MEVFLSRSALLIVLLGSLFGCAAQHVVLNAPPRSAPLPERMQAYQDLRLKQIETMSNSYTDGYGKQHDSSTTTWRLGNGTELTRPADLLQVVDPESETAHQLNQYLHASDEHTTLGNVALATLLGGIAVLATGLAVDNTPVAGVGALGVFASPFMYMVYLLKVSSTASEHLAKVPDLYNNDLSQHLAIAHTEEFQDSESKQPASTDGREDFEDTQKAAP